MQATIEITLVNVTCWCGTPFAMPKDLYNHARENSSTTFYCPHGHRCSYTESEADRLKKELAVQAKRMESLESNVQWYKNARDYGKAMLGPKRTGNEAQEAHLCGRVPVLSPSIPRPSPAYANQARRIRGNRMSFGPLLLKQLEDHRTRWTPLKAGVQLRSKLGSKYVISHIDGEKVQLKRVGVGKKYRGPRTFTTTLPNVLKRLTVVP